MSNQTKQKRPKYTIEFKQDAAKLVNEKSYTHKQAADNLGICNGQVKQGTFLSSLLIEFPLKFQRGLVA